MHSVNRLDISVNFDAFTFAAAKLVLQVLRSLFDVERFSVHVVSEFDASENLERSAVHLERSVTRAVACSCHVVARSLVLLRLV